MADDDTKTELIRRIWKLVGERREVLEKVKDLRQVVEQWEYNLSLADPTVADARALTHEGKKLIEDACAAGIEDCDALIIEALGLLAKVDEQEEEAANDEPDEGGGGDG